MVGPVSLPRSALTALDGERLAGIGHNQGPPIDGALSWRRFAWKKARAVLVPRRPIEVVRRRVRRATQLGLEYPQYASILLGTGLLQSGPTTRKSPAPLPAVSVPTYAKLWV